MIIKVRAFGLLGLDIRWNIQRIDWLSLIGSWIKPGIIELKKNPLAPLEIPRIGRIHFTTPVITESEALNLPLEI